MLASCRQNSGWEKVCKVYIYLYYFTVEILVCKKLEYVNSLCRTPSDGGRTSGAFGAGPLHSASSVGLGPVDGSPPGRLTEASGCRWELRDGGLFCAWAATVLERVPPVSWICSCCGGVTLPLRGGRSGGGHDRGGLRYGRRDGEVFDGRH